MSGTDAFYLRRVTATARELTRADIAAGTFQFIEPNAKAGDMVVYPQDAATVVMPRSVFDATYAAAAAGVGPTTGDEIATLPADDPKLIALTERVDAITAQLEQLPAALAQLTPATETAALNSRVDATAAQLEQLATIGAGAAPVPSVDPTT